MVDSKAETLFEKSREELTKSNIFKLMIPLSQITLQKKYKNGFLFCGSEDFCQTFKFTIYSNHKKAEFVKKLVKNNG